MAGARDKIENNIVLIIVTCAITSFGGGIGAYHFILDTPRFRAVQEPRASNALDVQPRSATSTSVVPPVQVVTLPITATKPRRVLHLNPGQYSDFNRHGPSPEVQRLRDDSKLEQFPAIGGPQALFDAPVATYTFVATANLTKRVDESFARLWRGPVLRSYGDRADIFEIHRIAPNEAMLVAYVSESDSRELTELSGTQLVQVTLVPIASRDAPDLVVIPLNRIVTSKARYTRFSHLAVLDIAVI
jgi:hypothetical protein